MRNECNKGSKYNIDPIFYDKPLFIYKRYIFPNDPLHKVPALYQL